MKTLDTIRKEICGNDLNYCHVFDSTIKALSEIGIDGRSFHLRDADCRWGEWLADKDQALSGTELKVVEHLPVAAQILQLKQENEELKAELSLVTDIHEIVDHMSLMYRAKSSAIELAKKYLSFSRKIDQLEAENLSLKRDIDRKSKEIGMSEHRGNTVDYIYDKCKTYGDQVMDLAIKNSKLEAENKRLDKTLEISLDYLSKFLEIGENSFLENEIRHFIKEVSGKGEG